MKKTILRGIFLVLAMLVAFMIFSFSAETGEESAGMSGEIVENILSAVGADEGKTPAEYEKIKVKTESVLRVLAHFGEYFLLGLFLGLFILTFEKPLWMTLSVSVGISFVYAVLDEWHQYYVPGRAMDIRDMITDTLGAACGAALAVLLARFAAWLPQRGQL